MSGAVARSRATWAWLPAAALLAAAWLATFGPGPWADESVNDLHVYRTYAQLFHDGYLPFRDVGFEYPPLAAPLLWLAGLAGVGEEEPYRVAFALLMLAAAIVALVACGAIARRTGGSERRALLAFAALPLLAGAMVRTHFDPVPVALALCALAALLAGRAATGFALAGAGAMTKAFPLLVAVVALAWLLGRGEGRAAARGALALVVTLVALGTAWVALSPEGAWDAVAYHLDRPVQVESLPAVALYAAAALGLAAAPEHVDSHRSDGLLHPAAGALAASTLALLLVALAATTALAARRPTPRALALAALTAIAAFATFGKVLSPQFLIWVAPLGALAAAWRLWGLAAAVAAALGLTLAEFPARYFDVVGREPLALVIVGARDLVLVAVVALALAALAREPRTCR